MDNDCIRAPVVTGRGNIIISRLETTADVTKTRTQFLTLLRVLRFRVRAVIACVLRNNIAVICVRVEFLNDSETKASLLRDDYALFKK